MLTSFHLHKKSNEVCIKARSTLASLLFKGLVTEHQTVKWSNSIMFGYSGRKSLGFFKARGSETDCVCCSSVKVNINRKLSPSETVFLVNVFNFMLCLCPPPFVTRIELFYVTF